MALVWDDPYFQQGDKVKLLVALAIADSARAEDGKAWPGIEKIAAKARTSTRGVQEAIRELEKDGKMAVAIGASELKTNVYSLLWTPQPVHPAQIAPCKRAAEKAAEFPPEKAAPDCTQSVRNHHYPKGSISIPEPLGDFSATWERYIGYRRRMKFKALLPESEMAQLATLAKFGPTVAAQAIEQTIANGWQGLFPEKIKSHGLDKSRTIPLGHAVPISHYDDESDENE